MIAFPGRWVYVCAMVRCKCNDVTFIFPMHIRYFSYSLEVLNVLDESLYTYFGERLALVQVIIIIGLVRDDGVILITPNNL